MTKSIRLLLGDQLSQDLSSLRGVAAGDIVLMAEVVGEATYVRHHKKKIAFLFSAMRHFAHNLSEAGYNVRYVRLDDPDSSGSLTGEVARLRREVGDLPCIATEPGEWRLRQDFAAFGIEMLQDDRFLCTHREFSDWMEGRKQPRMEFFYRDMRKKTGLLMQGGAPVGGQWNFDTENRKAMPASLRPPETARFEPDDITQEVLDLVQARFGDHFGDLTHFHFAVTRAQALEALDLFIAERLPLFGDYQDAMRQNEPFLYHSHLSFYINCGLLNPREVCEAAQGAYAKGHVPLNAAEGFIRQIIGWREYVRGLYWHFMPGYASENALGADRKLPALYWTGNTRMNCMAQCVGDTKANAYAHHIQRLMVLGNFALLAGLDPTEVNEWYLVVYADAYEWVELPNVTGMILHADGGIMASKPYAASGAYINRMSDYCKHCTYKVAQKKGPDACPFNYLYWDFFQRHDGRFRGNPRLSMVYRTLDAMDDERKIEIAMDADAFLNGPEMESAY